jgi:hypothetical protein
MCLRGLRLERTRQNREAAKEKRAHIKKVWAELDEGKFTEQERLERLGAKQENMGMSEEKKADI